MTTAAPRRQVTADGWRLAVGTLTALRVRPPGQVDAAVAHVAMLLAPIAALPLGIAVALSALAGHSLSWPGPVIGSVAVGVVALGTRCLHLDGLADTTDGLAASHDRTRALEVMKSGDIGPAGVVTLIVVMGLQVFAISELVDSTAGAVLAGLVVAASRVSLAICCLRSIPCARPTGLGAACAGTVGYTHAAVSLLMISGVLITATLPSGISPWRAVSSVAFAVVVLALLLRHVIRRLSGITGDVLGASVEVTCTILLLTLI
ncbi:adenosylcobinamide-GDP ribazoletransferase [Gordonia sp. ABSL11-1]|uniref:adenosylcobinamide-GDP ribazoletransferase n=1 Tax=Gordonia sp. ABSL11-1 TaxID=3053924 RepID=UPI0025733B6C|nr:adenosylcobinamide-GDP ribazoletransferase [Gordonia sp. ABSL11-1]MDL9948472.1 adenosylcobinamide-GDP ribazoletransferase [Gordonia sp. ABSL11-1]